MNIEALKLIKFERYFLATIMTIVMFFLAEITNQQEIIFPEILAIMTGAWIAKKQPWSVNKRKIFFLTCIASVLGVSIVRYLPFGMFFQVALCFILIGIILFLSKTTFIPIISACILPIYLGTTTWVYSISVSIMAFIIIIGQWLMEKYHLRSINHYNKENFDIKKEFRWWCKLFCIFGVISILPINTHNIFLLAPPLIVTFVEFSNPKSCLRAKAKNIYFLIVGASLIGYGIRLLLSYFLPCPLVVGACLACILLFAIFDYTRLLFPPAGAILLLPMILDINDVVFFPMQVALGTLILIPLAILSFPAQKIKKQA